MSNYDRGLSIVATALNISTTTAATLINGLGYALLEPDKVESKTIEPKKDTFTEWIESNIEGTKCYLDYNDRIRIVIKGSWYEGFNYSINTKDNCLKYYSGCETISLAQGEALAYCNTMNKAFGCDKCKK